MTLPAARAWASGVGPLVQPLSLRWQSLALRERRLVGAAGALLLLASVWSIGVVPAQRALHETPQQIERLDAELLRMRSLAAEAAALRGAAPVSSAQAANALNAASERLGSAAKLVLQGDRATLQLTGVDPAALQAWIAEVRSVARARPVELQLTRSERGLSGSLVVAFGAAG